MRDFDAEPEKFAFCRILAAGRAYLGAPAYRVCRSLKWSAQLPTLINLRGDVRALFGLWPTFVPEKGAMCKVPEGRFF